MRPPGSAWLGAGLLVGAGLGLWWAGSLLPGLLGVFCQAGAILILTLAALALAALVRPVPGPKRSGLGTHDAELLADLGLPAAAQGPAITLIGRLDELRGLGPEEAIEVVAAAFAGDQASLAELDITLPAGLSGTPALVELGRRLGRLGRQQQAVPGGSGRLAPSFLGERWDPGDSFEDSDEASGLFVDPEEARPGARRPDPADWLDEPPDQLDPPPGPPAWVASLGLGGPVVEPEEPLIEIDPEAGTPESDLFEDEISPGLEAALEAAGSGRRDRPGANAWDSSDPDQDELAPDPDVDSDGEPERDFFGQPLVDPYSNNDEDEPGGPFAARLRG
jgi:hypothetical protein